MKSSVKLKHCDHCAAVMINGVFCHEHGCPVAWQDKEVDCDECGQPFQPESKYQGTCPDCFDTMYNNSGEI